MFGGAVPDAITTLIRLIATLHDADGNLAVEGLKSGEASDLDYSRSGSASSPDCSTASR